MGSRVNRVAVCALEPAEDHALGVLPGWAVPAICVPAAESWAENQHRFAVRVVDDGGATGHFGPVSASVAAIVREQVEPMLVGRDVQAWRHVSGIEPNGRHRRGAHARLAVSAVELALWDLRSRSAGATVAELLGGQVRQVIPAYATALGIDVDHPLAADIASWLVAAGFWGQKWGLPGYDRGESPRADARRLARIRAAVGEEARLCVDARGRWDASYARQMLPVLAEHHVTWVEEPGAAIGSDLAGFGLVCAAGEHDYDPAEQIRSLTRGDVQVWQPDPVWNGGLAHSAHMIDLASALGIPCFPHGSGLAVSLQLAGATNGDAVPAVEYHLTLAPRRQAVHAAPITPEHGTFALTDEPGLGASCGLDDPPIRGRCHVA
jgi:L-rhamnonate dehydratase